MTKLVSKDQTNKSTYGQYCPLALATELLCRRWTILVVSRLIDGCRTFNEIHRGVPKISPSLLSTRLSELEHAGIVSRVKEGKHHHYQLTEAGIDLTSLVDTMAIWGQRWARDMNMEDLDPAFLAWSMSTRMNLAAMPETRTVIEFEFSGTPAELRRFWLVVVQGKVDMCLKHPGYESDLFVTADLRTFVEAWRGFRDLRQEIHSGKIQVVGAKQLVSQFPDWLMLSGLAPYERRVSGREMELKS